MFFHIDEVEKITGKKGHAGETTGQGYGGGGGGHRQSASLQHDEPDTGAGKPGMMEKMKGT